MKRRAMRVDRFHECAREAMAISDGDQNVVTAFLKKSFGPLKFSWADAHRVVGSSDLTNKTLAKDLVDQVFGRGLYQNR